MSRLATKLRPRFGCSFSASSCCSSVPGAELFQLRFDFDSIHFFATVDDDDDDDGVDADDAIAAILLDNNAIRRFVEKEFVCCLVSTTHYSNYNITIEKLVLKIKRNRVILEFAL